MGILVNKNTRVIVQGITGREGSFHTKLMLEYGTKIVAGVTPGKGGNEVHGVPVYDSIGDALRENEADASIIFVPAKFAGDAIKEAIHYNLNPIVVITEGIPIWTTLELVRMAKEKNIYIIGPNCPGIIIPTEIKLGIMPAHVFKRGDVAVISRSGTLTYEISKTLSDAGLGQSVVIGIGGDPVKGLTIPEALKLLEEDPETKKIVIIGEIGGVEEEKAAELIKRDIITKPVVAYIAGKHVTMRTGVSFGHAGAIVLGNIGRPESKIKAFQEAGVPVARLPYEVVDYLKEA
ncbi:MAG: succinate--CoA ligase subunit alpha [Candidatus Njordarchaeales archaeon]